MSRKHASQAPVLIVYVVTMLICFVIFGSAAVALLDKFVTQPKQDKLNQQENSQQTVVDNENDYASARRTALFVCAEGETINSMALLRILPDTLTVKVVPISPQTLATVGDTGGTLAQLFEAGGFTYLYKGIEDAFGITPEKYIKINNEGWTRLVEYLGGTSTYVFPHDLYYKDEITGSLTSFSHGPATRTLWGDDINKIINYPLYENGAKDQNSVTGEIAVCLINSACYTNSSALVSNIQNVFNTIYNNSDTDITSKDFKNSREAYEYLIDKADQPAVYRLPSGEWDDKERFTVSEEFRAELVTYFELGESK